MNSSVRPPAVAGTWYPGDAGQLRRQIEGFFSAGSPRLFPDEIVALVVPHAGYTYSGRTAAAGFRAVQGRDYEIVAVVAPYHAGYHARFLTPAHKAYATPLGEIEIDAGAVEQLERALENEINDGLIPIANDSEHAIEIELPFLQVALAGEFSLLPIMCVTQDPRALQCLGGALAEVLAGRSALLVASTDLSHFYPEPRAKELDEFMLDQIMAFSPAGVLNAQLKNKAYACGACAVASVLWAAGAMGADKVEVLDYRTSADASGDRSSVVGYGAAIVYSDGSK